MKRKTAVLVAGAFALVSAALLAAPYDYLIKQQNSAGSATAERIVPYPGPNTNGLLGWNNLDQKTITWKLGPSFMIVDDVINSATDWDNVTNRPVLAPVATSGNFNDLSNKPVIPGPQVQPDWNANSGMAEILNKPVLADVAKTGSFYSLVDTPPTFPPSFHLQAWGTIQGTPNTLSGYGITDAASLTQLDTKLTKPTGTTAQYLRGDGSTAAFPTAVSAFTNDSGYTTQAGARSSITLTTTGTTGAASYNSATGALNIPTYGAAAARVFSNTARSLNTAFQVSSNRDASVSYTVDISVTSVLLAGSSGRVYLEYADDQAMTANVVTVSSSPNATGGVLNVTNLSPGNVSGWVPAGKWARIRTATVSGTPTFTFQGSQEVLQ